MSALIEIGGIAIAVDADGRYCLNDLHKAAGGERRHGPSLWLENQQTKELADELSDTGIPVSVIKGGALQGTYVCKELVYAYAMWISAKFHLQVIRKFDALTNGVSTAAPVAMIDGAIQALKLAPLAMRAARAFGLDKNVAAISANQYVCAVTGHNLLKEFGATHLPAENQETQWFTPTELGSEAQVSARKLNEALAAAGLQERRGKVWELTPAGHAYARLFDTGKKHNSGAMVQQVKWRPSVLEQLRHTGSLL